MKHSTHISEALMNSDEYYRGDMDKLPAVFVLSSFNVDDYYFDPELYSKPSMKVVAEEYRALIEQNSGFPIYCFGAYGKYLITPSPNVLLTDSFYEYKKFKYTKPEPFHYDYFTYPSMCGLEYYTPKAFVRKICNSVGAEELIPRLLKHIAPVQAYFDNNIMKWNTSNFKVIEK